MCVCVCASACMHDWMPKCWLKEERRLILREKVIYSERQCRSSLLISYLPPSLLLRLSSVHSSRSVTRASKYVFLYCYYYPRLSNNFRLVEESIFPLLFADFSHDTELNALLFWVLPWKVVYFLSFWIRHVSEIYTRVTAVALLFKEGVNSICSLSPASEQVMAVSACLCVFSRHPLTPFTCVCGVYNIYPCFWMPIVSCSGHFKAASHP